MTHRLVDTVSKINLRQAKPVRLFEQAVEQIKMLILDGHLKPGDRLPSENELSQLLNVSRSSVREALRSLESGGLIQVRSGSGAFVSEDALVLSSVNEAMQRLLRRKDLVLQLLEVRQAIERLSVVQAAQFASNEELDELEEIIQQQASLTSDLSPDSLERLAQLDMSFHLALSKASKNDIVFEIISALVPSFREDNRAVFYVEEGISLVEEHRQIMEALRAHDPVAAEKSMQMHIGRVAQEIRSLQRIQATENAHLVSEERSVKME